MIDVVCNFTPHDVLPLETLKASLSNRAACLHAELLEDLTPGGFQSVIEIDDEQIKEANNATDFHDPAHPFKDPTIFSMKLSAGTKGSFAEVKMNTLKNWITGPITGMLTLDELLKLLEASPDYNASDPMLHEIVQLEDISQLLRRHHEWLRDTFGITTFPGGIRIPFSTMSGFRGEIRITFSALTGEQDLCVCLLILKQLQLILRDAMHNDWIEYDLDQIKACKLASLSLRLCKISQLMV